MISYIINKKRGSKMRNIHYKGIHEDRWVFGDLIHKDGMLFIGIVGSEIFQVADETVSEFTGVLDFTPWSDVPMAEKEDLVTNYNRTSPIKETVISFEKIWHGVPIYENDIVECQHLFDEARIFRGAIKFYNGCFGVEYQDGQELRFLSLNELIEYSYKVIGNVFKIIPKNVDDSNTITDTEAE